MPGCEKQPGIIVNSLLPDVAKTPYPAYKRTKIQHVEIDFVGLMSVAHQAILLYFALAVSSPTRPIFR